MLQFLEVISLPKTVSCLNNLAHTRLGTKGAQESGHYAANYIEEDDNERAIS
jgi:hypothetical protein